MYSHFLRFDKVSFTYPGSVNSVVGGLSFDLGMGWTCLAGANGSGKTTVLKIAAGLLPPDSGSVCHSGDAVYCPQRTDCPPEGASEFAMDWSRDTIRTRDLLHIGDDWIFRWDSLSQGEKKRLQIAVALWRKPSVLALDEPLNHLDAQGRETLEEVLKGFAGCGLLVSHDRKAMDSLCSSTLLFRSSGTTLYRSGYTMAVEAEADHRARLVRRRKQAECDYLKKKRDARRKMLRARTIQAHSAGGSVSFRDICIYGLDGPSRVDGIVQKAGRLSSQARARAARARAQMEAITYGKLHRTGIELLGAESHRNRLLELPEGSISSGDFGLRYPVLRILPHDRIAVTGPNGSGKSTLLRHLKNSLNCPPDRLIWIPQEITADESSLLMREARTLSGEELGFLMTLIRRLGSSPEMLLGSSVPSPGETRKLLLALGLLKHPWLIVMDEPTNHMDLPSIECLQKALSDHPGALLLVSHHRKFLREVTSMEWKLEGGELRVMA